VAVDNLVRGGQNATHNLKMLVQVCGVSLKWGLLAGASVFLCNLFFGNPSLQSLGLSHLGILGDGLILETVEAFNIRSLTIEEKQLIKAKAVIARYMIKLSWRAAPVALASFVVVVLGSACFFTRYGKKKKADELLRGTELKPLKTFLSIRYKNIQRSLGATGSRGLKPYYIGGIPLYKEEENTHIAIIGTTGTGKTRILLDLVEQIKQRGDMAVIYDPKGEFIQYFYDPQKDYITNPYDVRGVQWNILNEILSDVGCGSLAKAISPAELRGDPVWNKAAALVIEHFLVNVKCSNEAEKFSLTNRKILRMILDPDSRDRFLRDTIVQQILPEESPKTSASVVFMIANALEGILKLHNSTPQNSFSLRDWLKRGDPSCLFLGGRFEACSALSSYHAVLIDIILQGIRDGDGKRKILMSFQP
jgi:hypothetical protein